MIKRYYKKNKKYFEKISFNDSDESSSEDDESNRSKYNKKTNSDANDVKRKYLTIQTNNLSNNQAVQKTADHESGDKENAKTIEGQDETSANITCGPGMILGNDGVCVPIKRRSKRNKKNFVAELLSF